MNELIATLEKLDEHRTTITDWDTDLEEYDETEFDLMESVEKLARQIANVPDPRYVPESRG